MDWDARPGTYSLRAQATDDQGRTQPAGVPFNEQGYRRAAKQLGVTVSTVCRALSRKGGPLARPEMAPRLS